MAHIPSYFSIASWNVNGFGAIKCELFQAVSAWGNQSFCKTKAHFTGKARNVDTTLIHGENVADGKIRLMKPVVLILLFPKHTQCGKLT